MKTKKVKIGKLKIDPKLTDMRHINPVFVSRYRQAYRSGANMPFMIIQEGTNRVVSGNHRLTALLEEYGKDHSITVELRVYPSEKEVLMDFAKENSTHGNPIDDFTKKKLTKALLDEGVTGEEIANIFHISVQRVERLGNNIVQVVLGNGEVESRPSKKGFAPEQPISEKQYQEHDVHDRGLTVVQQAGQLTRWLKNNLISNSDENFKALGELHNAIEDWSWDKRKIKEYSLIKKYSFP